MILCSKRVSAPCGNKAVEILHVRQHPWTEEWSEHPRCTDHPAAADVTLIKRATPLAEIRIEKLS